MEIYKIIDDSLGDGIYICYKQKLLETAWQAGHGDKFANAEETPVPVEVLNLMENETISSYTRALAPGDPMLAWDMKDCAGIVRKIGRPLTPDVRLAIVKQDAGSSDHLPCNLIANDGETEITSGLGSGLETYFKICFGTALNEANPNLQNGEYILSQNRNGKWECVTIFQSRRSCVC